MVNDSLALAQEDVRLMEAKAQTWFFTAYEVIITAIVANWDISPTSLLFAIQLVVLAAGSRFVLGGDDLE